MLGHTLRSSPVRSCQPGNSYQSPLQSNPIQPRPNASEVKQSKGFALVARQATRTNEPGMRLKHPSLPSCRQLPRICLSCVVCIEVIIVVINHPCLHRSTLQDLARALLLLLNRTKASIFLPALRHTASPPSRRLLIAGVVADNCEDGLVEDIINPNHLLTTALHIPRAHLLRNLLSLLLGDWGKALRFQ